MDFESLDCWASLLSDHLYARSSGRVQEALRLLNQGDVKSAASYGFMCLREETETELTPEMRTLWWVSQTLKKFRPSRASDDQSLSRDAVNGFLERNSACKDNRLHWSLRDRVRAALARALPEIPLSSASGRFGPGAVVEGLDAVQRWTLLGDCDFHPRHPETWLPSYRPQLSLHLPGRAPSFLTTATRDSLGSERDRVARLVAVPKDAWRKRLISVEPARQSFLQQWVRSLLMTSIHRGVLRNTPSDFLSRRDNVELQQIRCLESSQTRDTCTLDLKDASDRISAADVLELFPAWISPHLERARTPYVSDSGQEHFLWMYGGMGNATTFLVETLYFWAVFTAIGEDLRQFAGASVFGDDVVLNQNLASHPLFERYAQERAGLVINVDKSCIGRTCGLREACGMVAYNGTPFPRLIRIQPPGSGLIGTCNLCGLVNRLDTSSLSDCRTFAGRIRDLTPDIPCIDSVPDYVLTPWGQERRWPVTDCALFLSSNRDGAPWDILDRNGQVRFRRTRWQSTQVKTYVLTGDRHIHRRRTLGAWEALGVMSGHLTCLPPDRRGRIGLMAPIAFRPKAVSQWITIH